MSTRRQGSATSLSRYARTGSPVFTDRDKGLSFCNTFWGIGDGGVDVLFARMRGAGRTMDELRNFWKERAIIEEDYARRLVKLSKQTLGRDEIGELRRSLDIVKAETERQGGFHMNLATTIHNDIEASAAEFYARQAHHKKVIQSRIEKQFKTKEAQEAYVKKAREKYEQDCMLINSYTAQSTLVQGRDLEKIHAKLERAQRTVHTNERDFANAAHQLQATVAQWEHDWKMFCDVCQDLEEERIDFMKDNMWAYANSVSTVCVSDDESCEKVRLGLEQMETDREMESFVLDYGTGNQIPDPPVFVNYTVPDAIPSSSSEITWRPAHFSRPQQKFNQASYAVPPQPAYASPQPFAAPPPLSQQSQPTYVPPPPAPAPSVPAQYQTPSQTGGFTHQQPQQQPQYGAPRGGSSYSGQQQQQASYQQPASYQQSQPTGYQQPPQTYQHTQSTYQQTRIHKAVTAVKALYDYQATIEEEFDFQAGDIIAVTATPEDGWWSGELLDEDRRQRGRHVFPSNFVCLF
ncbi:hypothetical protein FISHEDRAFT_36010 [Fistulina hepatica ATCC 64428]|uniref:SH3 domain-containing protein n=1 Tax=Fistulina hepatica ATCC 64428 TaxID=1128425 RepID=A0A0D7AJV8_9AGAR|nr:hypothetical protein FISHEDRAFT_36010 [Fistulina hepatica ATCC 64428]